MSETISSIHIYAVAVVFLISTLVYFAHSLITEWTYVLQQAKFGFAKTFPQAFKRVRTQLYHLKGKNVGTPEASFGMGDLFLLLSLTCVLFSFTELPFVRRFTRDILNEDTAMNGLYLIPTIIFISYVSQIFAHWIDVNDVKMLKVIKLSYEKVTEIFIILSIVFVLYFLQALEGMGALNQGNGSLTFPLVISFIKFLLMAVYLGVLCAPNSEDNRFFYFELGGRQNITDDDQHYQRVLGLINHHLQDSILILLFVYLFLGGEDLLGFSSVGIVSLTSAIVILAKFAIVTFIVTMVKISLPYELSERIAQRRVKIVFPVLIIILLASIIAFLLWRQV